jgi:hypothetical protein
MSPGPLTSHSRGGLHFQHGARQRFSPTPNQRNYFSPQQRFTVQPHDGGSRVTLDPAEQVTITTDDDGAIVIDVGGKPAEAENGNGGSGGVLEAGKRLRGLFGAADGIRRALPRQQRMVLTAQPDGGLLIEPSDPDNAVIAIGDPNAAEGVLVMEVIPAEGGGNGE